MDIGNRFSLEDFLAYFFPGVTAALGIYVLINMIVANNNLPSLTADITTGVIFFVLSYILGVIFSSFAELAFSKVKSHKEVIPLNDELKSIVIAAFRDTFKISQNTEIKWSRDHFYLCRSIVYERVPSVLPFIQRQSSLRQLRISLIPTLFVWLLVGIEWGIQNILDKSLIVGSTIIALSVIMFIAIAMMTINRARSNEWREVREVLTAFGASYRESQVREKTRARKI
ncbi:MAG: hypothetical protein JW963_05755 [Anaerolineales bacterium]|nr:hypothetical protein [Anaerolineales bacterium]